MKFEEILQVLDVLTLVEVTTASNKTLFKGRLIDIKPAETKNYRVVEIYPCSDGKETYLEITVY